MVTDIEIGKRLKKLRENKGVTIEEMSADTGISISSLNKYEIGYRRPRDENKTIIANYFDQSEQAIFFD